MTHAILRASSAFLNTLSRDASLSGRAIIASVSVQGGHNVSGASVNIDANSQTVTAESPNGGFYPAKTLTANLMLASGKTVRVNADFVLIAAPDLVSELSALDWEPFVPQGDYDLAIPTA